MAFVKCQDSIPVFTDDFEALNLYRIYLNIVPKPNKT